MSLARELCRWETVDPDISAGATKLLAWIIGVAERSGDFPVEVSLNQIATSFIRNGVVIAGCGLHPRTIKKAIAECEGRGRLEVGEGRPIAGGKNIVLTVTKITPEEQGYI